MYVRYAGRDILTRTHIIGDMGEDHQPMRQEPGFYEINGVRRYWTGDMWTAAEPKRASQPGAGKLNTIGAIALTFLGVGVLLAFIGGVQVNTMMVLWGSGFIGTAFSMWLTWLAVGAIVEAVNSKN